MEKAEKETTETKGSPPIGDGDMSLSACGKAFTPETARYEDEDEPCEDGVG